MYFPLVIFFETFSFACSICSVTERAAEVAKSPEPPLLQKIQPLVLNLPSRLGQESPEEMLNLYTLQPNYPLVGQ